MRIAKRLTGAALMVAGGLTLAMISPIMLIPQAHSTNVQLTLDIPWRNTFYVLPIHPGQAVAVAAASIIGGIVLVFSKPRTIEA